MPLDSAPVFDPITRVTDAAGAPISGATIEFCVAGTNTPKTVYADADLTVALGTTVSTNSGGYPVTGGNVQTMIWVGSDPYKIIVKDDGGSTILTLDDIRGAPEIPTAASTGLPVTPVVTKSASYTILVSDRAKLFNLNVTGGNVPLTLPSAVTAGDGFRVGARIGAGANKASIVAVGGQTISRSGQTTTAMPLRGLGEGVWLVSDGANWQVDTYTPALMTSGLPHFLVTARLTAAPASPAAGTRYIVSGTATGAWALAGYGVGDVLEANGYGDWIRYQAGVQVTAGWTAWVENEDKFWVYYGGSWVDLNNVRAPNSSIQKAAVLSYTLAQGNNGAQITAGAWTEYPINTVDAGDSIGIAAPSANRWSMPVDSYSIRAAVAFYYGSPFRLRLKNVTTGAVIYGSIHYAPNFATTPPVAEGGLAYLVAPVSVTDAAHVWALEYYAVASGGANSSLGAAQNLASLTEKYGTVELYSRTAMQGPQGVAGPQGATGVAGRDAGYRYQWTTITSGDPGNGKIGIDNAAPASLTQLLISKYDVNLTVILAALSVWDDSLSVARARIVVESMANAANRVELVITGPMVDGGGSWVSFPASYGTHSGTLALNDQVLVWPLRTGDRGDSAGRDYTWSTTTSGDPGTGKIGRNNASAAATTRLRINKIDFDGFGVAGLLNSWDDSSSGVRSVITIGRRTTGDFETFLVTGDVVDAGGAHLEIPVVLQASGGGFAANDRVTVAASRTGDRGFDGALHYTFSAQTAGVPATGTMFLDNADPTLATVVAVSKTDRHGLGVASVLANIGTSTSAIKGRIAITRTGSVPARVDFVLAGIPTDGGSYLAIPVSSGSYSGALFAAGDDVGLDERRTGDKGDTGAAGTNGTTVPDISGLTEDTAPLIDADYAITYDASAAGHKKALLRNLVIVPPTVGTASSVTMAAGDLNRTILADTYNSGGSMGLQTYELPHTRAVRAGGRARIHKIDRGANHPGAIRVKPKRLGTSSTTLTVGTGVQTLVTGTGLDIQAGDRIRYQSASANKAMMGSATSYTSGTGSLSVNVETTWGSSTASDWDVTHVVEGATGDNFLEFEIPGEHVDLETNAAGEWTLCMPKHAFRGDFIKASHTVSTTPYVPDIFNRNYVYQAAGSIAGSPVSVLFDLPDAAKYKDGYSFATNLFQNVGYSATAPAYPAYVGSTASSMDGVDANYPHVLDNPGDLVAITTDGSSGYRSIFEHHTRQGEVFGLRLSASSSGLTRGLVTPGATATVTMTIASPAVVTWTGHNFSAGQPVKFSTTGSLPTGVTAGTVYYVQSTGLTANTFRISATAGGSDIDTSGSQSGTHTGVPCSTIYLYPYTSNRIAVPTTSSSSAGRLRVRSLHNPLACVVEAPAFGSAATSGNKFYNVFLAQLPSTNGLSIGLGANHVGPAPGSEMQSFAGILVNNASMSGGIATGAARYIGRIYVNALNQVVAVEDHLNEHPITQSPQTDGSMYYGVGLQSGSSAARRWHARVLDAATNTSTVVQRLEHATSGTAAASFGLGVETVLQNASGSAIVAGTPRTEWHTATAGSEHARWIWNGMYAGSARTAFTVSAAGEVGINTTAGTTGVNLDIRPSAANTTYTALQMTSPASTFQFTVTDAAVTAKSTTATPLIFGSANTDRVTMQSNGDVVIGTAALATGATAGFFFVPSSAGTPTGTPSSYTGRVPVHYDTTNNKLYVYNGAWKSTAALT